MKKSIAVILLGSALLFPNNTNVEASYSDKEVQVHKVHQITCVGWDGKQYDFKNLLNKKDKSLSFYFNWIDFVNKYAKSANLEPTKPAEETEEADKQETPEAVEVPEVQETPKVEEKPETIETPEAEEAPEAEETPEVEQAPEKEQTPEKPAKEEPKETEAPEAAPAPTAPSQTPEQPAKPVEEAKPNTSISAIEQEVLDLTNAERQKAGLSPLQTDQKLMDSARAKSKDMSVNRYFSHTSPTYGSPFDQMKAFGVTYRSAAENIASGQRSAQEVVKAWMESPGHRENILTPNYTHIGIGFDANGNYWTQQFIQK